MPFFSSSPFEGFHVGAWEWEGYCLLSRLRAVGPEDGGMLPLVGNAVGSQETPTARLVALDRSTGGSG